MGQELVPQELQLQAKHANDENFLAVTSTGYLPRIQLMGSSSTAVKEGKFAMGNFALVDGKNLIDLTKEFVAVVLSWRPKAMMFTEQIISYYNPSTDAFKDIQAKADAKIQGYGWGPEFLLWLPEHKRLATYFLANPTGRREAPNIKSHMHRTCAIESILIKTAKYTWHGPRTKDYNLDVVMPESGVVAPELEKFNNPPETEVEAAETTERDR